MTHTFFKIGGDTNTIGSFYRWTLVKDEHMKSLKYIFSTFSWKVNLSFPLISIHLHLGHITCI